MSDGRGDDVVLLGAGDDAVSIAGGTDRVDGDRFDLFNGGPSTKLSCGGGRDVLGGMSHDQPVLVSRACEGGTFGLPDARVDLLTPLRSARAAVARVGGGCGDGACALTPSCDWRAIRPGACSPAGGRAIP